MFVTERNYFLWDCNIFLPTAKLVQLYSKKYILYLESARYKYDYLPEKVVLRRGFKGNPLLFYLLQKNL